MNLSPKCPDCGEETSTRIGSISDSPTFAGRQLGSFISGGSLWRCGNCHLGFRYPVLTKGELDNLYKNGADLAWEATANDRRDWRTAAEWLDDILPNGATVLDIGCFDGGFLDHIGARYHRFGIEIHPRARAKAEERGVRIIGSDFQEISENLGNFDCITAIDVIEHTESPRRFVLQLIDLVKPGGYILIATGNMDSPTFRLMGSRYWYCTFPEHISFISRSWCNRICEITGLQRICDLSFSHGRNGLRRSLLEAAKNLLYRLSPRLFFRLKGYYLAKGPRTTQPDHGLSPPKWMAAKDHFMIIFRKKP